MLWPVSDRATSRTEGLLMPWRPSVGGLGGVGRAVPDIIQRADGGGGDGFDGEGAGDAGLGRSMSGWS